METVALILCSQSNPWNRAGDGDIFCLPLLTAYDFCQKSRKIQQLSSDQGLGHFSF